MQKSSTEGGHEGSLSCAGVSPCRSTRARTFPKTKFNLCSPHPPLPYTSLVPEECVSRSWMVMARVAGSVMAMPSGVL
jgi:hypothetical protein